MAAAAALVCSLFAPLGAHQSPPVPVCRITGRATSAGRPLPGVAIIVSAQGTATAATSTDADGSYRVALSDGTFSLSAQLTGFTTVDRIVTVSAPNCTQTLDLTLALAPRTPLSTSSAAPVQAIPPSASSRFQRVQVQSSVSADVDTTDPGAERDSTDAATHLLLPPGFSTAAPMEAVAINGNMASLDRGLMNDRFAALGRGEFDPITGEVAPGFNQQQGFGGPGGRGGRFGGGGGRGGRADGPGGPGGFFIGGRGGRQNNVMAMTNYSFGGSALDAGPYQLRPDSPTPKQPYTKQNFGFTIGGPLKVSHLFDSSRHTSFIASYTGNRGSSLFDQFATVPTAAMRAGDFSAISFAVIDPATGLPFADDRIPAARISPATMELLRYLPLPNVPGATAKNFHSTTTTPSSLDNVNLRVIQNFTPAAGRGGPGGFAGGRGGGGRRFGGPGGRGALGTTVVLNAQLQYRRTSADQANVFPTLGGENAGWSVGMPVMLNVFHKRMLHNFTFNFSETHSQSTNQYAYVQNVTGNAGITGVSTDPFDWGVPTLSFAGFTTLRDLTPSVRSDRRVSAAYTWTRPMPKHTLRAGGDIRLDRSTSQVDPDPRGTFVFTGLYSGGGYIGSRGSGLDLADFLLGMPQQASVQYGPGNVSLDGRAMSLFVQDDWRKTASLTFSLGLRYELLWPFTESHGEMVNLDVAPDFSAAVPVTSGATGPFTGVFPKGLIQPDTNNLAPRAGVAWRITPGMVLRGGYGISYNSGTYSTIARQMVSQPPFAVSSTVIGTPLAPLSLLDPFAGVVGSSTTTNNYGVARTYDLGRVQTWNADVSRDLSAAWNAGVGYTEIRGANLDIVRAPNRGPTGLRIEGVQPFLWQTSEGASVLHAATFRLQRRFSHSVGGSLAYTLAKSRDNASTVGGGATVVAQNDQNLGAEWGLSSFDRRNQLSGNVSIELPWGPDRRWLNGDGRGAALLGNWRLAAAFTYQSGTPLTPLVQASAGDVARGTNGTLRANYDGQPIQVSNPTVTEFFNISAFSVPPPGTFGTAGRNTIIGPSNQQLSMQLSRDMRMGSNRTLTVEGIANNVLNTVNFAAVDTSVNSPTFGEVLSVRPRRSVVFNVRFRF